MRRPTTRLLALLLALVISLAACGSSDGDGVAVGEDAPTPAAPTEGSRDGTSSPAETGGSSVDVDGTIEGTFGGTDLEGGCVYLDADDGTRYELVRAPESSIVIDPQNRVIASASGEVIAREGDRVAVEGLTDPGLMTFCQIGTIFAVTDARAL